MTTKKRPKLELTNELAKQPEKQRRSRVMHQADVFTAIKGSHRSDVYTRCFRQIVLNAENMPESIREAVRSMPMSEQAIMDAVYQYVIDTAK